MWAPAGYFFSFPALIKNSSFFFSIALLVNAQYKALNKEITWGGKK
jgi:hypothetical protein